MGHRELRVFAVHPDESGRGTDECVRYLVLQPDTGID
jgi:hypothetical protein